MNGSLFHRHDGEYYTKREFQTRLAEYAYSKDEIDNAFSAAGGLYAPASHHHDSRYYTKSEVDALLSGKSDTGHTHSFASLTSKPSTVSGYGITDAYTKTEADGRYGQLTASQTWSGLQVFGYTDAATNSATTVQTLAHNSSGTPSTDFGVRQQYRLKSSTTTDQNAAAVDVSWSTATHASRKGQFVWYVNDAATEVEILRGRAMGFNAGGLGFLGAAPVSRQTVSGSRGGNVALANLLIALANYGLIVNSTT